MTTTETENRMPATDGSLVALNGSPAPAPQIPPEYRPRKSKDSRHFWRALRYLAPYKWMVAASIFILLAALATVGNVIRFFQEYLSDKAAICAVNDLRRRLYDHVLHVPLGRLGTASTSDITSRLVQDSTNLQDGFKTVLGQSI